MKNILDGIAKTYCDSAVGGWTKFSLRIGFLSVYTLDLNWIAPQEVELEFNLEFSTQ